MQRRIHPCNPAPISPGMRKWLDEERMRQEDASRKRASRERRLLENLRALAQPEPLSNPSKERFDALAAEWKAETQMLSSVTDIAMHPAYQQIIGMGKAVIPYMLSDFLAGNRNHWFWALTAITGENPITDDIAGNIKAMAEAWIEWGTRNGYVEQPEPKEDVSSE